MNTCRQLLRKPPHSPCGRVVVSGCDYCSYHLTLHYRRLFIPDDCWTAVFDCLSPSDRPFVGLVCKRWQRLSVGLDVRNVFVPVFQNYHRGLYGYRYYRQLIDLNPKVSNTDLDMLSRSTRHCNRRWIEPLLRLQFDFSLTFFWNRLRAKDDTVLSVFINRGFDWRCIVRDPDQCQYLRLIGYRAYQELILDEIL